MTLATAVNSLGLVMDIIGVLLLWKFGLPESISREGHVTLIIEESNQAEVAKAKIYDRWALFAVGALVLGFTLQLASNFLK